MTNLIPITLESTIQEYEDIYSFRFRSQEKIIHKAGQHCSLFVKNTEPTPEKRYWHPMTFSDAPHEEFLQFTMHTASGSEFKQAMLDLKKGDQIFIDNVRGAFYFEEEASALCIAGGIGYTPFRSMLLDEYQNKSDRDIDIIHVNDHGYIFKDEMDALPYEQDHITFQDLKPLLEKTYLDQYEVVYISGSKRFITGVKDILKESTSTPRKIKLDTFVGYDH